MRLVASVLVLLTTGLLPSQAPTGQVGSSAAAATSTGMPEGGGNPAPEPSTLLLVGTGLLGVALTTRRGRKLFSKSGERPS